MSRNAIASSRPERVRPNDCPRCRQRTETAPYPPWRARIGRLRRHRHRPRRHTPTRRDTIMGGPGVIDYFLEVFTRYIDTGIGLPRGEAASIAPTTLVIYVHLPAIDTGSSWPR